MEVNRLDELRRTSGVTQIPTIQPCMLYTHIYIFMILFI